MSDKPQMMAKLKQAEEELVKAKSGIAVQLKIGQGQKNLPTLNDVQNLILRLLTSDYGENPRWIFIRGMNLVKKVVVVFVPCLDEAVVAAHEDHSPTLARLLRGAGCTKMRSAGEVEHLPADRSPRLVGCRLLQILLSATARPAVACKKKAAPAEKKPPSKRLPLEAYLATAEERARSGYPAPKALSQPGWSSLTTAVRNNPTPESADDPDRALLFGVDCEMVMTASGQRLARCSVVDSSGGLVYDSLVRPAEEVTDYVTAFSGITAEKLEGVDVMLADVQQKLRELLPAGAILVGHSLENDFQALQLVHDRVVDTSLIFPHIRGWPHRNGLAGLCQSFLKRKMDRQSGHDSIEDARVALELVLLKFEKGPSFGAAGGQPMPLGRLLRGAGVGCSASGLEVPGDEGGGGSAAAAWHLEGCANEGVSDAAPAGEASESTPARGARFVVLRAYEDLCEKGAPAAEELPACLAGLEARLRPLLEALSAEDLAVVLSGCGDLHALRRLETGGQAQVEAIAEARKSFKNAFGIFVQGGDSLKQCLTQGERPSKKRRVTPQAAPQRDMVTYDI